MQATRIEFPEQAGRVCGSFFIFIEIDLLCGCLNSLRGEQIDRILEMFRLRIELRQRNSRVLEYLILCEAKYCYLTPKVKFAVLTDVRTIF